MMSCLSGGYDNKIFRFSEYIHCSIEDGNSSGAGVNNFPLSTPNFNVLAFRVSISQQPFDLAWGTSIDITLTFKDASGSAVHSEDIAVSSIFNQVSEKVYYNRDNVVVTGVSSVDIEYRVMTVAGVSASGQVLTSIQVDLFYEPIRY